MVGGGVGSSHCQIYTAHGHNHHATTVQTLPSLYAMTTCVGSTEEYNRRQNTMTNYGSSRFQRFSYQGLSNRRAYRPLFRSPRPSANNGPHSGLPYSHGLLTTQGGDACPCWWSRRPGPRCGRRTRSRSRIGRVHPDGLSPGRRAY